MLARLSWSHICLLLAVSDKDARSFYEIEIVQNGWSVRETKRQIEIMLFERLALSQDKKGLLKLSQKGQIIETPEDAIKDPYVLEFLGLNEKWLESDLEQALMDHLQKFLLELGKGFMFVGRQMRMAELKHYDIEDLNVGYIYTNLGDISIHQDIADGDATIYHSGRNDIYQNGLEDIALINLL